MLLVIEDLHWADSSTRRFVGFLARTLCSERLLVVGTYRSDELHRRHPLRPLLAELARDPYARLIELPRFTPRGAGRAARGHPRRTAPTRSSSSASTRAARATPLFAEELLAAGLDGRGALPPTLRDALMLRVERLSPRAQEVLRWLACQPAADDVLAGGAWPGSTRAELRDALREAVASQIVVDARRRSYGFRHALLREVVYDDLLPGERAELHARARARARGADRGRRARRAPHRAGGAPLARRRRPAAPRWPRRCARRTAAERVNAFDEALALLERALGLWERVPDPERLRGLDEVELLRARRRTPPTQAGEPARQEALLRRALELVDEEAEPRPRRARPGAAQRRRCGACTARRRASTTIDARRWRCCRRTSRAPSARRCWPRSRSARMLQSRFGEADERRARGARGGARGRRPRASRCAR